MAIFEHLFISMHNVMWFLGDVPSAVDGNESLGETEPEEKPKSDVKDSVGI